MTVTEVAKDVVALCAARKFAEAGEKYWADDVVSVEAGAPPGGDPVSRGKAAVTAKSEWFIGAHEIHGMEAHGPYINGNQFAVRFVMDMTVKQTGERRHMDEVGVYLVKDGKIVEERFLYGG
jgi:hypothetical protein